jgi:CRP-like cAMP-binding protein
MALVKRFEPRQRNGDAEDRTPFEMRSSPRVACSLPIEMELEEHASPLIGRLRDIGTGGVCVQTDMPFPMNAMRALTLHVPGMPLRIDGEACWQRESALERAIFTGVRFVRPSYEQRDRVRKFVEESAQELSHFLQNRSELHELGLDEALDLALSSRLREARAGTFIARQDSATASNESLFVVLRGSVTLAAAASREHELTVQRITTGGVFGGVPLVANVPAPFSVLVETDVQLLELDRDAYSFLERAKPFVARRLAQAIVAGLVSQIHALVEVANGPGSGDER